MKRMIAWTFCAVFAGGVTLGVAAVSGSQHGSGDASAAKEDYSGGPCANTDLRGTYGYFRAGTTAQGPLGAVGIAVYDGVGSFTTTQTISRNGVFTQVSFDGTYEVNPDCSGRLLSVDGQSVTGYLAIVEKGSEIFMLSASAGNAITGIAKKAGGRVGPPSE